MPIGQTSRPITAVLTQVVSDVAYLLQTEIRLARAELNEKIGKAASSGKLIGAGAVLMLAGLIVLLLAVARWLTVAGMPEEWSLTLVGGVVLAIGAGLAMQGSRGLKASALKPYRTLDQLRADMSILKEQGR